ncbi:MAG: hypothetical protein AAFY11_00705 [Cyanobacteria bacterium J06641_5]
MLFQEKILGTLLGARLGLSLAPGNQSLGLQIAFLGLEKLAQQLSGRSSIPESSPQSLSTEQGSSAEVLLAALPAIFLGAAEVSVDLAEPVIPVIADLTPDAKVRDEALRGAAVMAMLLRSPFPSPIAIPEDTAPAPIDREPAPQANSSALRAIQQFCDTPNDYQSCLQRAARDVRTTTTEMALTGAFLGAYQGVLGIPLSWQLTLVRAGIWSQDERLALAVASYCAGKRSWPEAGRMPIVGPVGSLQPRVQLRMPSWS